jgi:alkanesulfonate monooxygenase SsuD/methylene tetrahydromethanopterin reductase-like flavin-dependent oxidoreductase (luciferase family)
MRPPKKAAVPAAKPAAKKAAPKKAAAEKPAAPKKSASPKAAPAKRVIGTPEEIFEKIVDLSKGERITVRLIGRIVGDDAETQAFYEELRHVDAPAAKNYIETVMDVASSGWRNSGFFLAGGNAVFYVKGDRKKVAEQMDRYLQHLEMMAKQLKDQGDEVEGK